LKRLIEFILKNALNVELKRNKGCLGAWILIIKIKKKGSSGSVD
jgi:hypothetical protein